ncbi:MAG: sugar ABC transporter permease [Pyrinomonadaceae bacterium]|nr:sugar ABC transporter permease [Pyrinomonadaceae bacterium]
MSEKVEKSGFKIETSALRSYTMLGALILIWLFFHWQTGGTFLSSGNLSNLMLQTSVTGILAVGMLMLIIAGQIDLSVGSVLALAGGVAAIALTNWGYGLPIAIILAIAVGVFIGLIHGTLNAYGKIPAFIVTLGGLLAWRGAIKGVSRSETVSVADPTFKMFGQGNLTIGSGWFLAGIAILALLFLAYQRAKSQKEYGLGEADYKAELLKSILPILGIIGFTFAMNSSNGIPLPVLIFAIVAIFGAFITNSTTFGRYLYAIGGNTDAARLSGIDTKLNILKVYMLLGVLTGIAAIVFTARQGSATPDAGTLKELEAIAACVIGGASLMGGRGTVFGACLGALIMASLDNGMSLLNIRDFVQEIVKGTILVAAVGVDMIGRKS